MTDLVRIQFAKPGRKLAGTVVALAGPDLALGPQARGLGLEAPIARAAAAAGFSGLQAYWIARGWRRNEGLTVVLGIVGIAFALLLAWLYLGFSMKTGG